MLPLVSVRTVTYNHDKYIAQCLEGILMQRTSFPFEMVVGEDCSTDRTREIVLAYEKKYPDKIRVITSETNVGPNQNALRVQQACRGKYQAYCEGDDYWIDPLKLQKQVDFMETHPDVPMCFHNLFYLKEGSFKVRLYFRSTMKEFLTFEDACSVHIHLSSVLARSEVVASLPAWRVNVWNGDVVLRLWCAHHGNLGYLNDIMSVYRKHPGGLTTSMRAFSEKRYSEGMYLYRQFDEDTQFQHTTFLQAQIQQVGEKYQHERLGKLYYLLHPKKIIAILREYYTGFIEWMKSGL